MARSTAGEYIPDDLPKAETYNDDGTLNTISQTYLTKTWVMTFTYNVDMTVASDSGWVEQ